MYEAIITYANGNTRTKTFKTEKAGDIWISHKDRHFPEGCEGYVGEVA